MLNKPFKFFKTKSLFDSKKVSANSSDNSSIINGQSESFGVTPDILWENICFIESEKLIWTHGKFYNQDDYDRLTDAEIEALMPTEESETQDPDPDPDPNPDNNG